MIADIQTYSDVLKITVPNFVKLAVISYLVFITLPKYIFPQNNIENSLDRLVFNIIYMLSAILLIVPFLIFLHIFSLITLFLSFFLLKACLIYIFEKKNYFKILKNSYPPIFIKILNKLDSFSHHVVNGSYKDYKTLITLRSVDFIKFSRYVIIIFVLIYAVADINLINFVSLSNKTPDVSQFIEWVARLQNNILYAEKKSGGADFYGLPIIVFFFQVLTNIDSVLLFSLYPTLLFLFILLGIYYVIFKVTNSHYSAIFAIVIYVFYCLSPFGKYLTGFITNTANPKLINIFNLKFYFSFVQDFNIKKDLSSIAEAPFLRLNSGLAYEIGASFFLLNLYFLIMSFLRKTNQYLLLYSLTLFLVFTFHGGGAILLVVASSLIFVNAIIFKELNLNLIKKGFIAIVIPAILGNLWLFSWIKYGIPQDFGNAAPILDKIFSTTGSKKNIVETGIEYVDIVVFYKSQLFLFFLMVLLYPINLIIFRGEKSFQLSSISIPILSVIFNFLEENFGFPRLVSQLRCADYLFLVFALSCGLYFFLFEELLKKILKRLFNWFILVVLSFFIMISIFLTSSYNETKYFFKFTNNIQYNSIALALYKIKTSHEPFTYTIISFVQSFSKVLGRGYHINVGDFLQKYNPYAPVLPINTNYIYIIIETIPNTYSGLNEWYYRWRKDLELQLVTWVKIYSNFHNNIRLYFSKDYISIYEIDNREYVKKIKKEKAKKRFKSF